MTFPTRNALLGLTLSAFACFASAQNLAIVNGKPIPLSRVDALKQQVEKSGRQVTPEMMGQIKEELIAREIFTQEAQRRGIETTEAYKAQFEQAKQSILLRALFEDVQKSMTPSDAELKAEYDKQVAGIAGKEYRTRHILVEKEEQAKAIIASLKKGGKFEDIAKKQSKDPGSGRNGGDLDWATPETFVPEFSKAMVALKKGQTTDVPVKTQFGFHIIRLDDVRDSQPPRFEDVKAQLAQQMLQERMGQFQDDLRKKAKVE